MEQDLFVNEKTKLGKRESTDRIYFAAKVFGVQRPAGKFFYKGNVAI